MAGNLYGTLCLDHLHEEMINYQKKSSKDEKSRDIGIMHIVKDNIYNFDAFGWNNSPDIMTMAYHEMPPWIGLDIHIYLPLIIYLFSSVPH